MYRVRQIQVKKGHRLYSYCEDLTYHAARLYNRANYIFRQYATAMELLEKNMALYPNQVEVCTMIHDVTYGTKYAPKTKWINYNQMDYVLKKTKDPDYYSLPAQVNQQILKLLKQDYCSFFAAVKNYGRDKSGYTGRPRIPGYKKKHSTVKLTNQVCHILEGKYLRFPLCKYRLNLGQINGNLKEVRIEKRHDRFVIEAIMETPDGILKDEYDNEEALKECRVVGEMSKVLSIDPGTNNLLAVTNNFGEQPFLINGRILKSINQYYNKELARLTSCAELCNGRKCTRRIEGLTRRRNNRMRDILHKVSRCIVAYAEKHHVRYVVMGHNRSQKQSISLTKTINQNIVQIPLDMLRKQLKYKLAEKGIVFVTAEESYTSKADYLALDDIPVYGKEPQEGFLFSGKRIHRGLYRHYDSTISNADINGAANIMRKVFSNVPLELWDRGLVDSPYAVMIC